MKKWIPIVVVILLMPLAALYFMNNSKTDSAPNRPIKIVAFGDSLTAGYGVPERDSYPSQLRQALSRYLITMVNLGHSGDTTADALARVQQVVDEHADIVILGIGGNDALRGLPPEEAKANIEAIIKKIVSQPNPPHVVLLQMQAPPGGGLEYKRSFDAIYKEIANEYDIPLVPFIITRIYLDPKYVLADRIHMNKEGYAYVVDRYLKGAVEGEIKKLH